MERNSTNRFAVPPERALWEPSQAVSLVTDVQPTKFYFLGVQGSGKTQLAEVTRSLTGIDVLHLDDVQFRADWEPVPDHEVRRTISNFQQTERWICEGNPPPNSVSLVRQADLVVWLDTSFSFSFVRLGRRVLQDYVHGRSVCGRNKDSLGRLLSLRNSVLSRKIRKHSRKRDELRRLIRDVPHVVLRDSEDCFDWLWLTIPAIRKLASKTYAGIIQEVKK